MSSLHPSVPSTPQLRRVMDQPCSVLFDQKFWRGPTSQDLAERALFRAPDMALFGSGPPLLPAAQGRLLKGRWIPAESGDLALRPRPSTVPTWNGAAKISAPCLVDSQITVLRPGPALISTLYPRATAQEGQAATTDALLCWLYAAWSADQDGGGKAATLHRRMPHLDDPDVFGAWAAWSAQLRRNQQISAELLRSAQLREERARGALLLSAPLRESLQF